MGQVFQSYTLDYCSLKDVYPNFGWNRHRGSGQEFKIALIFLLFCYDLPTEKGVARISKWSKYALSQVYLKYFNHITAVSNYQ